MAKSNLRTQIAGASLAALMLSASVNFSRARAAESAPAPSSFGDMSGNWPIQALGAAAFLNVEEAGQDTIRIFRRGGSFVMEQAGGLISTTGEPVRLHPETPAAVVKVSAAVPAASAKAASAAGPAIGYRPHKNPPRTYISKPLAPPAAAVAEADPAPAAPPAVDQTADRIAALEQKVADQAQLIANQKIASDAEQAEIDKLKTELHQKSDAQAARQARDAESVKGQARARNIVLGTLVVGAFSLAAAAIVRRKKKVSPPMQDPKAASDITPPPPVPAPALDAMAVDKPADHPQNGTAPTIDVTGQDNFGSFEPSQNRRVTGITSLIGYAFRQAATLFKRVKNSFAPLADMQDGPTNAHQPDPAVPAENPSKFSRLANLYDRVMHDPRVADDQGTEPARGPKDVAIDHTSGSTSQAPNVTPDATSRFSTRAATRTSGLGNWTTTPFESINKQAGRLRGRLTGGAANWVNNFVAGQTPQPLDPKYAANASAPSVDLRLEDILDWNDRSVEETTPIDASQLSKAPLLDGTDASSGIAKELVTPENFVEDVSANPVAAPKALDGEIIPPAQDTPKTVAGDPIAKGPVTIDAVVADVLTPAAPEAETAQQPTTGADRYIHTPQSNSWRIRRRFEPLAPGQARPKLNHPKKAPHLPLSDVLPQPKITSLLRKANAQTATLVEPVATAAKVAAPVAANAAPAYADTVQANLAIVAKAMRNAPDTVTASLLAIKPGQETVEPQVPTAELAKPAPIEAVAAETSAALPDTITVEEDPATQRFLEALVRMGLNKNSDAAEPVAANTEAPALDKSNTYALNSGKKLSDAPNFDVTLTRANAQNKPRTELDAAARQGIRVFEKQFNYRAAPPLGNTITLFDNTLPRQHAGAEPTYNPSLSVNKNGDVAISDFSNVKLARDGVAAALMIHGGRIEVAAEYVAEVAGYVKELRDAEKPMLDYNGAMLACFEINGKSPEAILEPKRPVFTIKGPTRELELALA